MILQEYGILIYNNRPPEVSLRKGVPKICSRFTGEHPCGSVIQIKLLCNFTEITRRHGCSPVNWLHIFGTPFPKNNFGGIRLDLDLYDWQNIDSFLELHVHCTLWKQKHLSMAITHTPWKSFRVHKAYWPKNPADLSIFGCAI